MLKLIGAAIILCATTWAGFEAAGRLSLRPKQLRQLKSALTALEAEIMYSQTPLQEAAESLARQLAGPLSAFFACFGRKLHSGNTTVRNAWCESLDQVWGRLALKQGEYEILKQFGATLGRHDRLHEQKQIQLALAHLEREEAEALDRQVKYEKMVKSLGFLSGLLVTLLLL